MYAWRHGFEARHFQQLVLFDISLLPNLLISHCDCYLRLRHFGAQDLLDMATGSYRLALVIERVRPMVTSTTGNTELVSPAGSYTLTVKYDGSSLSLNGTSTLTITTSYPNPLLAQLPVFTNPNDTVDPAMTSLYLSQSILHAGDYTFINIQPRDSTGALLHSLLASEMFSVLLHHESDTHLEDRVLLSIDAGMANSSTGLIK
jgi:hypothetical protein